MKPRRTLATVAAVSALSGIFASVAVNSVPFAQDQTTKIPKDFPAPSTSSRPASTTATDGLTMKLGRLLDQVIAVDEELANGVLELMEDRRQLFALEELALSDPQEAARQFAELVGLSSGEKASVLQGLISSWALRDPLQALQWLDTNVADVDPNVVDEMRVLALKELAKSNPAEATLHLAAIKDEESQVGGLFSIAESWAETDPESALRWLAALQPSDPAYQYREEGRAEILRKLSQTDPSRALTNLLSEDSERLRTRLLPSAVRNLSKENLDAALQAVSELSEPTIRVTGLEALVQASFEVDSLKVFDLINSDQNLPAEQKEQLLAGALGTLAMQDLDKALDLLGKQAIETQSTMAESVTTGLLAQGVEVATDWANAQSPGPILDGAAKIIALEVEENQPTRAIEWLSKVSNSAEKTSLMRDLIMNSRIDSLSAVPDALQEAQLRDQDLSLLQQLVEDRLQQGYAELLIPAP